VNAPTRTPNLIPRIKHLRAAMPGITLAAAKVLIERDLDEPLATRFTLHVERAEHQAYRQGIRDATNLLRAAGKDTP
jgi:hypothetical protein